MPEVTLPCDRCKRPMQWWHSAKVPPPKPRPDGWKPRREMVDGEEMVALRLCSGCAGELHAKYCPHARMESK